MLGCEAIMYNRCFGNKSRIQVRSIFFIFNWVKKG